MTRSLSVWWDDDLVGTLALTRDGAMSFVYRADWIDDPKRPPISMSLPKRPQRFSARECRPFFAGLLPEDQQRDAVAAVLALSKHNDFALLDALGGDVAGALMLWPTGKSPEIRDGAPPSPLADDRLLEVLDALPRSPLLAGHHELRLSLAGAQPKLPVVLVDGKVALPGKGQPTTHIIKLPLDRFGAMTENELLVMRLAAVIGLEVAPVEARTVKGRSFLLVTRYDRQMDAAGRVRRVHQEDFCQALGIVPEHKYEAEGGPTFATSFDLVRRAATRPAVEVLKLLDAAIFNLIVGNADAHGKNFSLLYRDGEIRLAPLYDLVCTAAYPELLPRLAMKIGKRAVLSEMGVKTWPAFADATGLRAPFVLRRVRELCREVGASIATVASSVPSSLQGAAIERYATIFQERAAQVLRTAA